ncbi:hypothetical protein EHI46_15450 [Rhizobium leguminosarum]|uniref:hypothetical protein n=1 Tax=Rhizobium leguminosarum TaxID=384 RepID=UPI000FF7491A|nr:hypothetical protein [Rhizobium leguminosarum]RWY72337.1 hypothetical protein EHI46_15450 [Rhizobium leguminosarum]
MTDELMNAILAMNAYDFGANKALDGTQHTHIGDWTITTVASPNDHNFSAVAYVNGSDYEISYRGTTDVLGTDVFNGDFWNGWTIGAGSDEAADVQSAISFYQSVLQTVTTNGGTSADITLTGHSLGGGLTGLVGTIYGVKGYLFDNMPFELAAEAAYNETTPGSLYNPQLAAEIWGTSTPTPNDESKLSAYATVGEALTFLRNNGGQSLPVTGLDSGATDELSSVQLHSMALAAMLVYASDNNLTDWSIIAPYFIPQLWDDDVATAAGVGAYKTVTGAASTALQEMIAYSAIDEGTMLYGDVAIKSMFDDAGNLSDLVPANIAELSADNNTNGLIYQDLSQIAVQYAGQLAAEKSTDAALGLGVIHSDSNVISVDLTPGEWSNGQTQTPAAPEIVGARNAVIDAIMSVVGTPTPLESNQDGFASLFGAAGTDLVSGITEIKASAMSGVTLDATGSALTYSGTAGGALLIGSPNGNTTFIGGGGTNIMVGQASDTFDLGVGNNIVLEENAGTATLDFSAVSDTATSPNWNMVEGTLDGAETFVFNSADLAPLTIVYGADGSDTFDFEAGADDNIGVYILQIDNINQANFLALDPSKIGDYIEQNFGSNEDDGYGGGFDDKIVLINPTATDILKYNGQIISDPTRYLQYTDSALGGESTLNPNMQGGSYGMGERSVDSTNNLKLVGDANTAGGIEAYYTDAWTAYSNTSNNYALKSGNVGVTRDYAYSNDYETLGPQNKLVLTGLTADQSSFSYTRQNWDGSETDTETSYYDSDSGSLSLVGFNTGDFGINFANNGAGSDFQESDETYAVSEWAQANVDSFNGLPEITGIQPASLGSSLGTSSIPLTSSEWNVVGDDAYTSEYNRPSLTANDFMRAA